MVTDILTTEGIDKTELLRFSASAEKVRTSFGRGYCQHGRAGKPGSKADSFEAIPEKV